MKKAALLIGAVVMLAGLAPAAEEQIRGPLAVLALYSGQVTGPLSRAARALGEHLEKSGRVQMLGSERIVLLLSGGERDSTTSANLERIKGIFQQGYIQSYSFEYEKALKTLGRVLSALSQLKPGPERWELWTRAKIFEGISLLGLERKAEALQSFVTVLRTRPAMQLDRREYSPSIIQLWDQAKNALATLPLGRLAIDSDPAGAMVFLDGVEAGVTPYIGSPSQGRYHMQLSHPEAGLASRWVDIGPEPVRIRLQLVFEGALALDAGHPGIRLAAGDEELPSHWWPWLGERLGLKNLIVLFQRTQKERPGLGAALVDLESGNRLREGWLEWRPESSEQTRKAVAELADFLVTGKASPTVQIKALLRPEPRPGLSTTVPLVLEEPPRPRWRKFWPWGAGAGGLAVGALISHLLSRHYREEFEAAVTDRAKSYYKTRADGCLGGAIALDVLAGGCLATGLVLYYTYKPEESAAEDVLLPALLPGGAGLTWTGRF